MVSSFLEAILIEAFGGDSRYVFVIYYIRIIYVYINLFCEMMNQKWTCDVNYSLR